MMILVTGASGLLGSHVKKELELQYPDQKVVGLSSAECDLTSQVETSYAFKFLHPRVVWHCAGLVGGIDDNMGYPFDYVMQNALMGLNVVNACVGTGVRKVYNMGSSCMYPRACKQPMHEYDLWSGPLEPTNQGYAAAKLLTMMACDAATMQHKLLNYRTFIPCNLYGPGNNFGSGSHVLQALVAKICDAHRSGSAHITIWGDGTARREFLHAKDCAEIMVHIDKSGYPGGMSPINIGSGVDLTIMELAVAIAAIVGWQGTIHTDEGVSNGTPQKLLDIHVQRNLGLLPKINLESGIREMVWEYNNVIN